MCQFTPLIGLKIHVKTPRFDVFFFIWHSNEWCEISTLWPIWRGWWAKTGVGFHIFATFIIEICGLKYAENTFQKCYFDAYVPKARDTVCCSEQNVISLSEKCRFSLKGIFLLSLVLKISIYKTKLMIQMQKKWNMSWSSVSRMSPRVSSFEKKNDGWLCVFSRKIFRSL